MNWLGRHRIAGIALICAICTGIVMLGRTSPEVPFLSVPWNGEQAFHDLLRNQGRPTKERSDLVFVGIDQQSRQPDALDEEEIVSERALQLMSERPFPWSREVWALLLDKLFAAGARVVVFDLIFNPPNEGDPAFAAALERYRDRVVLGSNFDQSTNNQHVVPNSTLIPQPQARDARVGYVNFWSDVTDGVVREIRFTVTDRQLAGQPPFPGEWMYESLGARALAKFGHTEVPRDLQARPFRFGPPDAYAPINLYEIFLPRYWEQNFQNGAVFRDKLVMIGASAQIMQDFVATPLGPNTPGPAVHLHAIAAALENEFLAYTPVLLGYTLLGAAGLLAWGIVALIRRPLVVLSLLLGVTLAYLAAARLLFDFRGFFLLTVPVLSAFLVSGLLSLGFEYWLERLEKLRTRRTLERYVSKNLVKEILENPDSFYSSLRGVRLPVTVLFSDLVGFTTMTESADPEKLVKQLNEYLSRMTAAVFQNHGTLDKFIGDAVMAVWGNVSSRGVAEDAKSAARAAATMRRELQALNEQWVKDGIAPFSFGLGINHGEAVAANIGSQERADPTVIGDAVNLASRLEGLTRTYGVDILLGPTTAELIRDAFHLRTVAYVQVKGKTRPVETFTLIGARGDEIDPEWLRWLETYEEAIVKFRAREFSEAKILLSRFLEFYPEDGLAKSYLQRTLEYEKEPPDANWTAAEVFTKK